MCGVGHRTGALSTLGRQLPNILNINMSTGRHGYRTTRVRVLSTMSLDVSMYIVNSNVHRQF